MEAYKFYFFYMPRLIGLVFEFFLLKHINKYLGSPGLDTFAAIPFLFFLIMLTINTIFILITFLGIYKKYFDWIFSFIIVFYVFQLLILLFYYSI